MMDEPVAPEDAYVFLIGIKFFGFLYDPVKPNQDKPGPCGKKYPQMPIHIEPARSDRKSRFEIDRYNLLFRFDLTISLHPGKRLSESVMNIFKHNIPRN